MAANSTSRLSLARAVNARDLRPSPGCLRHRDRPRPWRDHDPPPEFQPVPPLRRDWVPPDRRERAALPVAGPAPPGRARRRRDSAARAARPRQEDPALGGQPGWRRDRPADVGRLRDPGPGIRARGWARGGPRPSRRGTKPPSWPTTRGASGWSRSPMVANWPGSKNRRQRHPPGDHPRRRAAAGHAQHGAPDLGPPAGPDAARRDGAHLGRSHSGSFSRQSHDRCSGHHHADRCSQGCGSPQCDCLPVHVEIVVQLLPYQHACDGNPFRNRSRGLATCCAWPGAPPHAGRCAGALQHPFIRQWAERGEAAYRRRAVRSAGLQRPAFCLGLVESPPHSRSAQWRHFRGRDSREPYPGLACH